MHYYGLHLLSKVNVLMRTGKPGRNKCTRLLMDAKKAFESSAFVSAQDVFSYYLVCARYYTSVSRSRNDAEYYIQKAMDAAGQSKMAPIEIIDQVIIPAADMMLELQGAKESESLLLRALETCEQLKELLPYQRRKKDLYQCLLDVYRQTGNQEKVLEIEQILNGSAY